MANTLTIGSTTSLRDLQTFLEGSSDKSRVYGKKDAQSKVITLYLKPKGITFKEKLQSFADSITGRSATRRSAAREGIKSLFTKLESQCKSGSTVSNLLNSVINEHADGFSGNRWKAHRPGELGYLARTMQKMVDDRTLNPQIQKKSGEDSMSELGLGMKNIMPQLEGGKEITIKAAPDFISKNTHVTAKSILINGKRYEPVKHIATGGFGYVFEYVEPKGGHRIAFKITPSDSEEYLKGAAKEISTHKKLCETKNNHVIDFVGAVRLPDGCVGIASELAPLGDVQRAIEKIKDRIGTDEKDLKPGQITRAEANILFLTLLKDMAMSMQHLHEKGNMTHLDFKNANFLLDQTGHAKLSDFGTTFSGNTVTAKQSLEIDCPSYKAPELCFVNNSKQVKAKNLETEAFQSLAKAEKKDLANHMKIIFGSEEGYAQVLADNVLAERDDILAANSEHLTFDYKILSSMPQKADIWGFGASAVEMFTEGAMFKDLKYMQDGRMRLEKFALTSGENAIAPRTESNKLSGNSVAGSSGDGSLDQFLNQIMKANPKDRPTAGQIVQHKIFKEPGVGLESARLLLSFIIENDNDMIITSASESLREDIKSKVN